MHQMDLIKRWFAAPVFEDDEESTRRAGLLNLAIVISLLITGLLLIGAVIGNQGSASARTIAIVFLIVLLLFV